MQISFQQLSYRYHIVLSTAEMMNHDISRIIEMAWEDRIPFEAIKREYGLNDAAVIQLMRENLKLGSFKLWRERITGRKTKHLKLRDSRSL